MEHDQDNATPLDVMTRIRSYRQGLELSTRAYAILYNVSPSFMLRLEAGHWSPHMCALLDMMQDAGIQFRVGPARRGKPPQRVYVNQLEQFRRKLV